MVKTDRGRAATRGHEVSYLAECLWAGVSVKDIAEVDARARSVAPVTATHGSARYTGALFVPNDDVVFFFFDGPSLAVVRSAAKRARIPFDRILETLPVGDRPAATRGSRG